MGDIASIERSRRRRAPWGLLGVATAIASFLGGSGTSSAAAHEQARKPLRVVLVLDSSGSMSTSDPKGLSRFSAEVLSWFLDDQDRLGVVWLNTPGVGPTAVRDAKADLEPALVSALRPALHERMAAVAYGGETPCLEALTAARAKLGDGDEQKAIVFVTDGVCEDHVPEKVRSARRADLLRVAKELGDAHVPVFGIGLGPDDPKKLDFGFIQEIARANGDEHLATHVRAPEDLPAVFADVSGRLRNTQKRSVELLPGTSQLLVDTYLHSLTLLVAVDAGASPLGGVHSPDGASHPEAVHQGIFRFGSRDVASFGIVRVQAPASGQWSLDVTAAKPTLAHAVFDYDLRARTDVECPTKPGDTPKVRASLVGSDGTTVTEPALLGGLVGKLEIAPKGAPTFALVADGVRPTSAGFVVFELAGERDGAQSLRVALRNDDRHFDVRDAAEAFLGGRAYVLPPGGACLAPGRPVVLEGRVEGRALGNVPDVVLRAEGSATSPTTVHANAPDATGRFTVTWTPSAPGTYLADARLGDLVCPTPTEPVQVRVIDERLTVRGPRDGAFELTPGRGVELPLELDGSGLSQAVHAELDRSALRLPEGVTLETAAVDVAPGTKKTLTVRLTTTCCTRAAALGGELRVALSLPCTGPTVVSAGPLTGAMRDLPWWARVECWWKLHKAHVAIGVPVGLFVAYWLLVLLCAIRKHIFPHDLKIVVNDKDEFSPDQVQTLRNVGSVTRRLLCPFCCINARATYSEIAQGFEISAEPSPWYLESVGEESTTSEGGVSAPVVLVAPADVEVATRAAIGGAFGVRSAPGLPTRIPVLKDQVYRVRIPESSSVRDPKSEDVTYFMLQ